LDLVVTLHQRDRSQTRKARSRRPKPCISTSLRWQLSRVGHFRFLLRRPQKNLRAQRHVGMQGNQDGHRAASADGMGDVQEHHTGGAAQHTGHRQFHVMLPERGSHRRRERCKLFAMQSVSDGRHVIADYDPQVHSAPWHNDLPFALGLYDRHIKKCRGCGTTFATDERFVVCHQELRDFWKKGVGRTMVSSTSFYHCNITCISPRHPYFDVRSLTVSPRTLLKLTADDVREIRHSVVRHLADFLHQ